MVLELSRRSRHGNNAGVHPKIGQQAKTDASTCRTAMKSCVIPDQAYGGAET